MQVVSVPTHYSSYLNSLIDLVFLSSPKHLPFCDTLPLLSNSNHIGLSLAVSLAVSLAKPERNPTRYKRKVWRYAHADFDLANQMLSTIDWSALLSSNDVNSCWLNWHSKFLQVMETCIPQHPNPAGNLPHNIIEGCEIIRECYCTMPHVHLMTHCQLLNGGTLLTGIYSYP